MVSSVRQGNSIASATHTVGPVAIGSFIAPIAGKTLKLGGTAMAGIISHWPAIAGPALARYTMPAKMTKAVSSPEKSASAGPSILLLRVDPAKALDVQYASPQLIERINQALGYQAVTGLRLLQAPIQGGASRKPQLPARPKPDVGAGRLGNALARMAASRHAPKAS